MGGNVNATRKIAAIHAPQWQTHTDELLRSRTAAEPKLYDAFFSAHYWVIIAIASAHIGIAALIFGSSSQSRPTQNINVQRVNIIPISPAPLAIAPAQTPETESSSAAKAQLNPDPAPQPLPNPKSVSTLVEKTPHPEKTENPTSATPASEVVLSVPEIDKHSANIPGETRSAREEAGMGSNPAPIYPPVSRKLREQGISLLLVHILANGQVAEVTLARSSGYPRLDESAINAVKQWRYQPALENGVAVDSWYQQPVEFTLRK